MRFRENLLGCDFNQTIENQQRRAKRVNSSYRTNKRCFDEQKYFEDICKNGR